MTAQHIRTPAGEELVILPLAEYQALIAAAEADEDAEDVAAYDAARAALAAGADRTLPAEVSAHILKGASRLTAWRKHRGLTQQALAAAADVGQGYLSQIENGQKAPAPETVARLAAALDVPADHIA